ncbi:MAG TPA: aldehyde dehydrogenase family protein [Ilumatobacteraceae bacterium]
MTVESTEPPLTQHRHDHWIGGKSVPPSGGGYLSTLDPRTRRAGDEVAAGTAADVDLAVDAAAEAQPAWGALAAGERAVVLHAMADAIDARADELIVLERAATGKLDAQARMEVAMSASYFRYYAGVLRAHHGRTIDQGHRFHTYTRHEPYGVVGIITPWNYPQNQACRGGAPALAAGNAVVIKPSEFTSPATVHLGRVLAEAGLPGGLFNVVTGTGPVAGTALVTHPLVRRVTFTGSVATGRAVAALAGDRLVPVTLELGGKSPIVVFADADLDRVVQACVTVVAMNAGQVCTATTRLIAAASIHDELVARIVGAVAGLEPGIDFGPAITEAQYHRVLQHFADASDAGLAPAIGGTAYAEGPGAEGLFIRPTVYVDVPPEARIRREEIFGPVLVTISFTDEADALRIANDTEYGLYGSVWSGDVARGLRMAEQIEAGQITVNGGPLTIETPLGGYKNSGYGREKGLEALDDYSQVKTISVALS